MATAEVSSHIANIDPATLRDWLARGEVMLVDVREPFEHVAERIEGAALNPLGKLDVDEIKRASGGRHIVFQCRSGKRSLDAAGRYSRVATEPVYSLAGGIEAWKSAGLPVQRPASSATGASGVRGPRIDVMRQVQMTAGALVLIGVLLGAFVSPWFLVMSGFVGGGLFFAGASGWCGMAKLLALMPWNRVQC